LRSLKRSDEQVSNESLAVITMDAELLLHRPTVAAFPTNGLSFSRTRPRVSSNRAAKVRMTAIAIIPARGGSKGIPGKNIKHLAGRPLIHWAIRAAMASNAIDRVYVSTDDPHIAAVAKLIPGTEVLTRDPATATDTASTESVIYDALKRIGDFDDLVLIQATSPLLTSGDIDRLFQQRAAAKATSALTVVRQKRFLWRTGAGTYLAEPANYDPMRRPRRQEFEGHLVENGAAYLTTREAWTVSGCRLSGPTVAVEMDEASYVELDEPHDWAVIESLMLHVRQQRMRRIRLLVTDVDGTLTDGGMAYGAEGETSKVFNTRDAAGMARLQRDHGIELGVITGENSPAVHARMCKLGIQRYAHGTSDKVAVLRAWCRELGIGLDQVAYIGDDYNDLGALRLCGISACPSDAPAEIAQAVDLVMPLGGGCGCVRAFADTIRASICGVSHA
jgi:YrbI family 3-deoxy-D-manno-octulosonate 8-phosphate phosphatase